MLFPGLPVSAVRRIQNLMPEEEIIRMILFHKKDSSAGIKRGISLSAFNEIPAFLHGKHLPGKSGHALYGGGLGRQDTG